MLCGVALCIGGLMATAKSFIHVLLFDLDIQKINVTLMFYSTC
jgi:hypothetical protein